MRRTRLISLLLLITPLLAAGQANANVECVKTRCESKGRPCVETLNVAYEACTKTARKNCDAVPVSEKFNCLRNGLAPCSATRNKEQTACFEEVRTCYKSCGPFAGKRADFWCVTDSGPGATAAFCATNPDSSPLGQCAKAFKAEVGMTCDQLY